MQADAVTGAGSVSLAARLVLTAVTVAYGVGPFVTDMNRTHLFNPQWTGHARLHLMWWACSQLLVALIAVGLIWSAGPDAAGRCRLAWGLGIAMVGGFFVAVALARRFQGTLHDPGTARKLWGVDGNLLACLAMLVLLLVGWWLLP